MKSLCSLSDENSVSFRLSHWRNHGGLELNNHVIKKVNFLKGILQKTVISMGNYLYALVSALKE